MQWTQFRFSTKHNIPLEPQCPPPQQKNNSCMPSMPMFSQPALHTPFPLLSHRLVLLDLPLFFPYSTFSSDRICPSSLRFYCYFCFTHPQLSIRASSRPNVVASEPSLAGYCHLIKPLRLCMGISDEIENVTIAIDDTTISQIKATI